MPLRQGKVQHAPCRESKGISVAVDKIQPEQGQISACQGVK